DSGIGSASATRIKAGSNRSRRRFARMPLSPSVEVEGERCLMMDKTAERVLVVPTAAFHEIGVFQGFCPRAQDYLPRLLAPQHLSYRPRCEVETDPSFKQLIPYVILKWGDQVFHYQRGNRGTETRLQALRSIGVGGHIRAEDGTLFDSPY